MKFISSVVQEFTAMPIRAIAATPGTLGLGLLTLTATLTVINSTSVAQAATLNLTASDAYYTFRGNVSSNRVRLLGDKATAIGLPGQDTVSFLKFAQSTFPTDLSQPYTAILTLQHDPSLGGTLIPASNARPVSLSVYNLLAAFDRTKPGGNLSDVDYGSNGSRAIDTTSVGNPGLYTWDISSLFNNWLQNPTSNNGIALSGVYGNVNIDDRNSYGIFHTIGSLTGAEPTLSVEAVPEPTTMAGMALFGLGGLLLKKRQRSTSSKN
jgi:hypothetical protein